MICHNGPTGSVAALRSGAAGSLAGNQRLVHGSLLAESAGGGCIIAHLMGLGMCRQDYLLAVVLASGGGLYSGLFLRPF